MRAAAWRYYARFYRGERAALLLGVGAALGQSALLAPIALLVRHAFDTAIPARDLPRLLAVGGAMLALYLAGIGAAFAGRTVINRAVKRAIGRLRHELLLAIYAMPRDEWVRADLAILHARIVHDTERLDTMSDQALGQILPATVTAAALGGGLFLLNPLLCFVFLLGGVPLVIADLALRRRVVPRVRQFREAFEGYDAGVLFALRALDLTRSQTAEGYEQARQRAAIEAVRDTSVRMNAAQSAWGAFQDANITALGVVVLIAGGGAVIAGQLSLGGLLSAFVLLGLLRDQARAVLMALPRVLNGRAALDALHELATTERRAPYAGVLTPPFDGTVTLEGVTFGYDERPLLRGVDLTLGPRAGVVALVGPSGAGKSTIVNLILGYHRPQAGVLRAGGHDYAALDLLALRRRIGVVPQDPLIIGGTVAENIAYGMPEASRAAIERAAALAAADPFIRALPAGYDTRLGEDGLSLSGGQRQRLAIARAILRRPALLLLDEPTNHLDSASVREVMANLLAPDDAPAILLISHDASILTGAMTIYELREGRVVPARAAAPGGDVAALAAR